MTTIIIFRRRDDWSLNKAKSNIELHYGPIGIMEDMHTFLQVLEALYPSYFEGATRMYDLLGKNYI